MPFILSEIKTYFHKFRTLVFVLFLFFMTATFSFLATSNPTESSAVSTAGFSAGNIISDAVMANYNSMTVAEIQAFLTSKNPCNNRDYNAYVRQSNQYPTVKWHWTGTPSDGHFVCISEERFGDGTVIGEGQTAAEIIYGAAQANKINPQVLLVLLEKEQSLISDPIPHSGQYRAATGYGCPDTAACDSKYYGFKNQVYRAAELFRYTLDNGYYAYPEKTRGVYVAYNPSSSCGRSEVYIENRATAALYRYTPYQPNAAALSAGFGMGDSCSAYGNRNFYLYFTQWFGSTQATVDGTALVIPEGTYTFALATSDKTALGVSGSNVQLSNLDDTNNYQRWIVTRDQATGLYSLTNVATNKRLGLAASSAMDEANVQVYTSKSDCSQLWKAYQTSDNYITFESACSNGMVIDSTGKNAGNNNQMGVSSGSKTQKWILRTGETVSSGNYAIVSSRDQRYGLDIAEAGTSSGSNVHFWTHLGYYNQLWHFDYQEDTGDYIITNPYSNLNVDVSAANYASGTNIQVWEDNSTCAQRWKVAKTTDGNYYLIASCNYNYSLDLKNDPADGNNIQLWQTNDTPNQKWVIKPAVQGAIDDGIYTIASRNLAQSALDIVEARTNSGANVYLWNLHGNYNQLWRVTYNAKTDDYTIINPRSGHSLDVSSGLAQNGSNVQIWEDNSTCAQRWQITKTNDGYYTIATKCDPSFVLDVADSASPGNNLVVWSSDESAGQKWWFRPLR